MAICKAFLAGHCTLGSSCSDSHDESALNTREGTHGDSNTVPGLSQADGPATSTPLRPPQVPCESSTHRTTSQGQHEDPRDPASINVQDKIDDQKRSSTAGPFVADFEEASVTFKEGVQISDVKLADNLFFGPLFDLPPDAQPKALAKQMEGAVQIKMNNAVAAQLLAELRLDNFGHGADQPAAKHTTKYGTRLDLYSLSCTWDRSARVAILSYANISQAMAAVECIQTHPEILGNLFRILGPADSEAYPLFHLFYLHPNTEEAHLEGFLAAVKAPKATKVMLSTWGHVDEITVHIVEERLRRVGGLEYFSFIGRTSDGRSIEAVADFSNRDSAMRAVETLNDTRIDMLSSARLAVSRRPSIVYVVPVRIGEAVQSQVDALYREVKKTSTITIGVYHNSFRQTRTIRALGESERTLAPVRAAIEKLIRGDVMMNGEWPLWYEWFAKTDGLAFVNKFAREHNFYIFRDVERSHLRLYGCNRASKAAMECAVIEAIVSAAKTFHAISLNPDSVRKVNGGGWTRLRTEFGNAVSVYRVDRSAEISAVILYGSPRDLEVARILIMGNGSPIQSESEPDDCSVCWTPSKDPQKLSCGHTYCRDCFYNATAHAAHNPPFKCVGEKGECEHLVEVREAMEILPYRRFLDLLQGVLAAYVHAHAQALRYCPTPDCPSLYKPSSHGVIFACCKCLRTTCTTCHVGEHNGFSCAEWQACQADGGMKALQQYKEEHDVRDCPRCQTAIDKFAGCMHVLCAGCKAHICWFCMAHFDDGLGNGKEACYNHMSAAHGGFFDRENPNGAGDPGWPDGVENAQGEDGDGEDEDEDDVDADEAAGREEGGEGDGADGGEHEEDVEDGEESEDEEDDEASRNGEAGV